MPAPVVTDINALVAQYQAALKPQQDILDTQVASNDASGVAQEAGLGAAQKGAFGQIEQKASDKGMAFSGFAPSKQAEYTGATYLPELAKLQQAIAQTRMGLLGKKADLNASANERALDQNTREKTAYQQWVDDQEKIRIQQQEAERQRQFDAAEAQKNRNATASNQRASSAASAPQLPSQAQFLAQAFSGYKPAKEGGQAWFTEREIIPAFMATYGITEQAAKNIIMPYRRRVFGE